VLLEGKVHVASLPVRWSTSYVGLRIMSSQIESGGIGGDTSFWLRSTAAPSPEAPSYGSLFASAENHAAHRCFYCFPIFITRKIVAHKTGFPVMLFVSA
jgi:hypothetical protein